MENKLYIWAALGLLFFSAQHLRAQDSIQRYSFVLPELRLTPDARFGGMANVGIAMPSDPNSMHFNPSALAFNPQKFNLGFAYNPNFESLDEFFSYLSAYRQLGSVSTIGASFRFISQGLVDSDSLINSNRNRLNQAMEINLAYAHRFGKFLSVAVGGKYIQSSLQLIDSTGQFSFRPANAFAFDASMTFQKRLKLAEKPLNFRAGLALSNIGSKLDYTSSPEGSFLPANVGLGISFEYAISKAFSLVLASDMNKLMVPAIVSEFNEDGTINPDFDRNGNGIPDYMEQNVAQAFFRSFADNPSGENFKELLYSVGLELRFQQRWFTRIGFQGQDYILGLRERLAAGVGARFGLVHVNLSYSREIEPVSNRIGNVNLSLLLNLSGRPSDEFTGDFGEEIERE